MHIRSAFSFRVSIALYPKDKPLIDTVSSKNLVAPQGSIARQFSRVVGIPVRNHQVNSHRYGTCSSHVTEGPCVVTRHFTFMAINRLITANVCYLAQIP